MPRKDMAERWRSLQSVWPVATIFVLVIGGIYVGWFTPTEGAAVGAVATGLYALGTRRLNWPTFVACVLETASAAAMIYFIILGAAAFNTFFGQFLIVQALPALVGALLIGSTWSRAAAGAEALRGRP